LPARKRGSDRDDQRAIHGNKLQAWAMKVLVTGAAGFIGRSLCHHLLDRPGLRLVGLDKLTYAGHLSSLAELEAYRGFAFVKADISDYAALPSILRAHKPDAIVHLAAETHVDRSIDCSKAFVEANIVGTHALLEATRSYLEDGEKELRRRFRFVHVSTDEVYGSLGPTGEFTEASPFAPRSPYAATKAASSHLALAWFHTYGLPVIVSACCNNYGPYQMPEKLIPMAILNAIEGRPIPVYGDGLQVRDWLHVRDHVEALGLILKRGRPGETYAIGGRNELTNLAVVQQICRLVDRHIADRRCRSDLIEFVQDRPGHDHRYALDSIKVEREVGWRPAIAFEQGLEATVLWYLRNPDWWQPIRRAGHGVSRIGVLRGCGVD
jgi:dTDP-glucose 4,6-dehydratase